MALVLGVDSSTQSTKALLVDAGDGTVVATGTAPHPPGTEVDPRAWLAAVDRATEGLLERADAVAVAGQQHGMVALGADGDPVRDALLWNDTRSSGAARDLIAEMGGPQACADAMTSVKNGAVTRATSPGSAAYASVMRLRKRARMMQPPRQIFATSPLSICQSWSIAPCTMASKPCE